MRAGIAGPSLSPPCRGAPAASALPPFVPIVTAPLSAPSGTRGAAARDSLLQQVWAARPSTKGWSGPAELFISRGFCHHAFRRASSLLAVSFSSRGCARNIFSSSHHPLFKSFLPSEEGAHGNSTHGADFLPAFHSWDPVGTATTHLLGAPRYPQSSRGASLDGWWASSHPIFPGTRPRPSVLIHNLFFTLIKHPTTEIL